MRAISPHDASIRGGVKASALPARAVEKLSASSALKRERQDSPDKRKDASVPLKVELVCRDDTKGRDPFWDAPRLVPTFVTQLLGQGMPQQRQRISVEAAYGRAVSVRNALLVDRKF